MYIQYERSVRAILNEEYNAAIMAAERTDKLASQHDLAASDARYDAKKCREYADRILKASEQVA